MFSKSNLIIVLGLLVLSKTFIIKHSLAQVSQTQTKSETRPKFSNESSLSIVTTGGNSISESYAASTLNTLETQQREYDFFGDYTLSYADDPEVEGENIEETARNWKVGISATQKLSPKWGIVAGLNYEGNIYAGYNQRENADLGTKYKFYDSEKLKSNIEVGYRYTKEKRVQKNDEGEDKFDFHKGNVQFTLRQKINNSVSYRFWIQYLPNFTESEDYQINIEPSLKVLMSEVFSLKVSYRGNYDNQLNPGVEKNLDFTTSTSLVAKF